jgi:Mrp family chromosome partitioning ATPase
VSAMDLSKDAPCRQVWGMSAIGSSVGRLIAVTSCKGGVGKSTVSLELARRLAARGHRVGLFDADVHGPSLPTQLPLANEQRVQTDRSGYSVLPLEHDGLKLMSFGWFSQLWNVHKDDEIRIGRPMLCVQLLMTTAWGELDYLVVDSPPGTGEVLTALATRVPLTGALVVTTPSKLAAADVVRGVRMLRRHDVPVVALVENMASFSCDGCGAVHHPFGRGHLEALRQELPGGLPCFSLPIVPNGDGHGDGTAAEDANSVDAGGAPPTPLSAAMEEVAACVERATAHTAPVRHHESTLPLPFTTSTHPRPRPHLRPRPHPDQVQLPHELRHHELPHWPTEMSIAEIELTRAPYGKKAKGERAHE